MSTKTPAHTQPSLEQKHVALLDCLKRTPFLRVEDLTLELRASHSQISTSIRTLRGQGLLTSLTRPAGDAEYGRTHLYFITPAGLTSLMHAQRLEQSSNLPQEPQLVTLFPRLDRLLFGQAIIHNLLVNAARFFGEQGKPAVVRWTLIRDYHQTLVPHSDGNIARSTQLFVDWLLVFHIKQAGKQQEQMYPLFLLLDHECLPQQQIRQRLQTILQARQCAAHEHPCAFEQFPLVMILLPGWHRARHWQRLAAELNRDKDHPLRGCLAAISVKGIASRQVTSQKHVGALPRPVDIWQLSWHTLHRYGILGNLRSLGFPSPATVTAVPKSWVGPSHHALGLPKSPSSTVPDLLGLALERSHYRIIEILFAHPFLSQTNLAAFLRIQSSSVRQYLSEMRSYNCLDTEPLPGDPAERWRLSSQGLRLVALRHHIPLQRIATLQEKQDSDVPLYCQKGLERHRRNAVLTAAVYTFFTQLLLGTVAEAKHQLLWWETTYAREQSYYVLSSPAWKLEKPHGIGEYQAGSQTVRFWLEWCGDWNITQKSPKTLVGYASYIRSKEWKREGHVLPILLLVCPDGERERSIQQLARAILGTLQPKPIVLSSTVEKVTIDGPLAPIWSLVLSPETEADSTRRFFYDVRIKNAPK